MCKNTGGPAFPLLSLWDKKEYNGMTLRDYFAAKAMVICPLRVPSDASHWCYKYADAMLEAREK